MANKLKPCPFCGGSVALVTCTASTNKRTVRGTFECEECGARIAIKTTYHDRAMAALDEAWNRRVNDGEKAD